MEQPVQRPGGKEDRKDASFENLPVICHGLFPPPMTLVQFIKKKVSFCCGRTCFDTVEIKTHIFV